MTRGLVTRRRAGDDDAPYVDSLLVADALVELASVPEPVRGDLAAMQVRARRTAYAESCPDAVEWLVLLDGSPVGRVLLDTRAASVHVVDIRLDASTRGRGVGSAVLLDVCAEADSRGLPVSLDVRAGSPVEGWYRRHGFVDAGPRDAADADRRLTRPVPL